MTYARLCEHGEVKPHGMKDGEPHTFVIDRWGKLNLDPGDYEFCPGGSVLPDDTLVVEKVGDIWQLTNEGFAAAEDAYLTMTGKVSMRGLEMALWAFLDSLAAAQGSQE